MQSERRRARRRGASDTSDADLLGRLTHLPGGLWVAACCSAAWLRSRSARPG